MTVPVSPDAASPTGGDDDEHPGEPGDAGRTGDTPTDDSRTGDTPADDGRTDETETDDGRTDGGSDPTTGPVSSQMGELVIPMSPRDQASLALYIQNNNPEVPLQVVSLALGEGYPENVLLDLGGSWIATEDSRLLMESNGTFALNRAEATSPDFAELIELVDSEHLRLEASLAGDYSVFLEGTWTPNEPGETVEWSTEVLVRTRTIQSVTWRACGNTAAPVLSGAGFQSAGVSVYDESGEMFSPLNASSTRPVTIYVQASADTRLSTIDGLPHLIAEGPNQTVTLRTDLGPLGSFELIGPERVTSVGAYFSLCAPWTRGGTLDSGMQYVANFSRGDQGEISVVPHLQVGETRVCSPVPEGLLDLRSLTPDTCAASTERLCTVGSANALKTVAIASAVGICQLVVEGSTLGADGLQLDFDVVFYEPR